MDKDNAKGIFIMILLLGFVFSDANAVSASDAWGCQSLDADETLVSNTITMQEIEAGDYAEVFKEEWTVFVKNTGCHKDSLEMYQD